MGIATSSGYLQSANGYQQINGAYLLLKADRWLLTPSAKAYGVGE